MKEPTKKLLSQVSLVDCHMRDAVNQNIGHPTSSYITLKDNSWTRAKLTK